jgi:hypothetical protein
MNIIKLNAVLGRNLKGSLGSADQIFIAEASMHVKGIVPFLIAGSFWSLRKGLAQPDPLPRDPIDRGFAQAERLPGKIENKLPGSDLVAVLAEKSPSEREELIYAILERGHFPDFLRNMRPVTIRERGHALTFWVMPDYVAIGSDEDYVLMPMNFITAKRLARTWGMALPTAKMVDAIYQQAERTVWPKTMSPGPKMGSMDYIEQHNNWILGQRYLYPDPTVLQAGHKKDIVLSRRLYTKPDRIAIYGWHNIRGGEPIQPLSTWHGERYVDYSHGVRMIGPWVQLDGQTLALRDVLRDDRLAGLLSSEGTLDIDRLLRDGAPYSLAHNH